MFGIFVNIICNMNTAEVPPRASDWGNRQIKGRFPLPATQPPQEWQQILGATRSAKWPPRHPVGRRVNGGHSLPCGGPDRAAVETCTTEKLCCARHCHRPRGTKTVELDPSGDTQRGMACSMRKRVPRLSRTSIKGPPE